MTNLDNLTRVKDMNTDKSWLRGCWRHWLSPKGFLRQAAKERLQNMVNNVSTGVLCEVLLFNIYSAVVVVTTMAIRKL